MNSFKDVFTPKESIDLIKNTVLGIKENSSIQCIHIADGGEFSHDIVHGSFICEEVEVSNIVTPYKKKITSKYLKLDDGTAFITSANILRMGHEYDKYKNPLELTSFGLGQLINHAIENNTRKILIGLGGTNTVDCGIGMAQALGVKFIGKDNKELKPNDGTYFSGNDLLNVKDIDYDLIKTKFIDISIETLCDGTISINDMTIPNNQKISHFYDNKREYINNLLKSGILNYSKIVDRYIPEDIKNDYYGVAGGINLTIMTIFNADMTLGVDYFIENLDIENKIIKSDLIITGEGRFDNSLNGKAPVGIARIAKKHDIPLLYLVGSVDNELEKYFDGFIAIDLPIKIQDQGIKTIISCHSFYTDKTISDNQVDRCKMYKVNTPIIFEKAIRDYFICEGIEL